MAAAALKAPAGQPLVLLALPVDDEREMYEEHLGFDGFRTAAARTREEAIQKAVALTPHAIVIGQRLHPGGEQVCTELKGHPATSGIPCVLITSYKTAKGPSDAALVRPVMPQALSQTLKLLIKKSDETA